MPRERNFGRGKYHPPPPDGGEAAHRPDYANQDVTPTEHAVKLFEKFVRDWTPPALPAGVLDQSVSGIRRAIRNIMPIDDDRKV